MEVVRPSSLNECLSLLQAGGATPIAGGTDLLVNLNVNPFDPGLVVDISGLDELRGIEKAGEFLKVGALVTFAQLEEGCLAAFPFCGALSDAAWVMGSPQIRHRATIGGNLVTGSSAADGSIALLALDARVELTSAAGRRELPFAEFFQGYKLTAIRKDELLTAVKIPLASGKSSFYKVGKRNALAIALVSLAIYSEMEGATVKTIRIAAGSIAALPVRLVGTERFLIGKQLGSETIQGAEQAMQREIQPITDARATAAYRRELASNILCKLLSELSVNEGHEEPK